MIERTLEQVADIRKKARKNDSAQLWCWIFDYVASRATGCHKISGRTATFFEIILQETWTSNANSQVVYPWLEANLEILNEDLIPVWPEWAKQTFSQLTPREKELSAQVIIDFSDMLAQFPGGSKASNLELALTGYEIGLTVINSSVFGKRWAAIQNSLGLVYSNRIQDDRAENLEKAIASAKLPCWA